MDPGAPCRGGKVTYETSSPPPPPPACQIPPPLVCPESWPAACPKSWPRRTNSGRVAEEQWR
eukprot:6196307-Pleurochrysis_carterae.AAC.3